MTQEIIEMARDSGMELYGLGKDRARFVHHLVAFANLVAAKALAEHAMHDVQRLGQEIEQERPWIDLTDEDRNDCLVEADPCECLATPEAQELMRCVEAKLKELNHGK